MIRLSTAFLCALALAVGFAAGTRSEWVTFSNAAHAHALDQATAEKLYGELRTRNVMQEGSELLAKIARLTTNSVVHIQSERRTQRRGLVEETGSGVLVESDKARG